MFQLGFFRFIQSDFQPYFFSFSTQNNSSILSDFRCGRGYSGGLPWGWILPRGGAKSDARYSTRQGDFESPKGDGQSRKARTPPHLLLQLSMCKTELFHKTFWTKRSRSHTCRTSRTDCVLLDSVWFAYVTGFFRTKSVQTCSFGFHQERTLQGPAPESGFNYKPGIIEQTSFKNNFLSSVFHLLIVDLDK